MAEIIRTENLQYAYPADEGAEPVLALKGVDLTIEQGSFVVVLGHNGSGKSTLAKTLNGVLLPCGGHVYVEGMDTLDEHLLLAIRRTVGMVFQNPDNQIVANVVEEDVAFAPENLGVSSREIRQRVDDALAAVGMGEFARHAPHLLSGGQKQRIAIAGVIAMEPKVLILDEPTAGLDPVGVESILGNIRDYHQAHNATIILVSHSMEEVARTVDRLVVVNDGRIPFHGAPSEVFQHGPELEAMGLGVPQMTRVFNRLRAMGVDIGPSVYTIEQAKAAVLAKLKGVG